MVSNKRSFLSGLIEGIALCGDLSGAAMTEKVNELMSPDWASRDAKNIAKDAQVCCLRYQKNRGYVR